MPLTYACGVLESLLSAYCKFPRECAPVWSKNLGHIYYTGREMANFALKFTNFRYHGNKGRSWVNFRDSVKLRDLENPLLGARISAISLIRAEI